MSSYVVASCCKTKAVADIVKFILDSIIIPIGNFTTLIVDNELSLSRSENFKEFLDAYKINKITTANYSAWQNSAAERKVKRIKEKLRIIVRQTGRDFPEVLGFIINSINKATNEAKLTAEQILFGFSTPSQSDELVNSLEANDQTKYNSILKKRVEEFHKKSNKLSLEGQS